MSVSFCFLFFFFFYRTPAVLHCSGTAWMRESLKGQLLVQSRSLASGAPILPGQTFMFVHLSHIVSLFLVQYCWTPFPESQQPAEHCGASKSVPRTWRSKIKREACWVTLGNFTFNFSLKGEKQKQKTHTTPLLFSVSFLPYITIKKITPSFSWE